MEFPEKIKQVFVEGWFKIIHSKNLQKDFLKIQEDILDCYAKEEAKWEALISKAEKDCSKCHSEIEEHKQKLQQLLSEFPKQNTKDGWGVEAGEAKYRSQIIWTGYSDKEIDEWKKRFEELLK